MECAYPGANLTVPMYLSIPGLVPDTPETTTRSPTWERERERGRHGFENKISETMQ